MKTPPAQPSVTAKGPLLEAVGLSKSFRPVEVLKDVSLAPGLTGGPSQAQQSTNGHGASPAPGTAAFGAKRPFTDMSPARGGSEVGFRDLQVR
jgi:hypothetical protein